MFSGAMNTSYVRYFVRCEFLFSLLDPKEVEVSHQNIYVLQVSLMPVGQVWFGNFQIPTL